MTSRPRASHIVIALSLSAACSFDPSALGGGSGGGGVGGGGSDGGGAAVDGASIDAMSTPDAEPEPACAALCPGTCDQAGTCHITCGRGDGGGGGGGLLPGEEPPPCGDVACPAGIPCYVHCIGQEACERPIDCSEASSCRIDCNDERSCAAQLTCGAGPCEINCSGSDSCTGGLSCSSSCFCDVRCDGDSSCDPQTVCPPGCDADPECKTSGAGCASSC